MALRKRGKNSRRNYKRRRRDKIRAALQRAQQSNVIVPIVLQDQQPDKIVDYAPSMVQPKKEEETPIIAITPETKSAPVILSDCDKRLIDVLSDPAQFAEFKTRVQGATENKLLIVG